MAKTPTNIFLDINIKYADIFGKAFELFESVFEYVGIEFGSQKSSATAENIKFISRSSDDRILMSMTFAESNNYKLLCSSNISLMFKLNELVFLFAKISSKFPVRIYCMEDSKSALIFVYTNLAGKVEETELHAMNTTVFATTPKTMNFEMVVVRMSTFHSTCNEIAIESKKVKIKSLGDDIFFVYPARGKPGSGYTGASVYTDEFKKEKTNKINGDELVRTYKPMEVVAGIFSIDELLKYTDIMSHFIENELSKYNAMSSHYMNHDANIYLVENDSLYFNCSNLDPNNQYDLTMRIPKI